MGFTIPTPVQREVVPLALAGGDLIATAYNNDTPDAAQSFVVAPGAPNSSARFLLPEGCEQQTSPRENRITSSVGPHHDHILHGPARPIEAVAETPL